MSIWFGVRNSVSQMAIERLDGTYNTTNEVGQYPLYNTVGGVVVTGNEDGAHACAETTLFNLTHLGREMTPLRGRRGGTFLASQPSRRPQDGRDHRSRL